MRTEYEKTQLAIALGTIKAAFVAMSSASWAAVNVAAAMGDDAEALMQQHEEMEADFAQCVEMLLKVAAEAGYQVDEGGDNARSN